MQTSVAAWAQWEKFYLKFLSRITPTILVSLLLSDQNQLCDIKKHYINEALFIASATIFKNIYKFIVKRNYFFFTKTFLVLRYSFTSSM